MFVRVDQVPGPWRAALKRRLLLPLMPESSGSAHAALCHLSYCPFQLAQRTTRRVSLIGPRDTQFLRSLWNLVELPARGVCWSNRRHELQPGRSGQVSSDSSYLDESQTRLGQNRGRSARLRDYQRSWTL